MNNSKNPKSLPQWIELGKIITLLVPLLYIAGWSYAYHYFDRFHLGLLGLDIPKEYLFVYSFMVIKWQYYIFVLILTGLAIGYFLIKLAVKKYLKRHPSSDTLEAKIQSIMLATLAIAVLMMFWVFYLLGNRASQQNYDYEKTNDFPSYPRVKVWVKTEEKQPKDAKASEWEKGCYRLLLKNKENLYLFYPGNQKDKISTDIIPAGRVETVRMVPVYETTKECN